MAGENDGTQNLTPGLETLWGDAGDVLRKRRAGLTREDIVTTAIELADRSGLPAVSMASIAKELGFSTMAIYRHIPSKAELLMFMVDAGLDAPLEEVHAAKGWRAGLERMAREIAAVYRQRPWLFDIPITGPPVTPSNIRWMEAGLATLKETGLTAQDRFAVFFLMMSFVRGSQRFFVEISQPDHDTTGSVHGAGDMSYGALLTRLMPPRQFPEVEEMIAVGILDQDDSAEEEFDFALQRVLDGIEVFVDAKSQRQRTAKGSL